MPKPVGNQRIIPGQQNTSTLPTSGPRSIEDYTREREQAGQAGQVPNYVAPPPPPPPHEMRGFDPNKNPGLARAEDNYTDWNRSAGVAPEDEIFGEFARGNVGNAFTNLAYGAPGWSALKTYLKGADPIYSGGSPEALDANRSQYDAGILGGQDMTARGEGIGAYGADAAAAAGNLGMQTGALGMNTAMTGMNRETNALNQSINAANRNVASLSNAQQQAATDNQARQMQAMAASARGGNAAAALRAAGAQGSQNQMQTSQLLAQTRLAEDQAMRTAQIQAHQNAATQYGNRANTGFNAATAGANTANTSASTIGTIGGNVMNAGTDNTKTFVDAELQQNKDQMEQDRKNAEEKGGFFKKAAGVVGSFFGGG
jgi:hypothetical protein